MASDVVRRARNKLQIIDAATTLQDLRSPPGNDLKRRGDGLWQIRVNDQYRILFSAVSEVPLRVEDMWFGDPH